jgi:hypothetical protein
LTKIVLTIISFIGFHSIAINVAQFIARISYRTNIKLLALPSAREQLRLPMYICRSNKIAQKTTQCRFISFPYSDIRAMLTRQRLAVEEQLRCGSRAAMRNIGEYKSPAVLSSHLNFVTCTSLSRNCLHQCERSISRSEIRRASRTRIRVR